MYRGLRRNRSEQQWMTQLDFFSYEMHSMFHTGKALFLDVLKRIHSTFSVFICQLNSFARKSLSSPEWVRKKSFIVIFQTCSNVVLSRPHKILGFFWWFRPSTEICAFICTNIYVFFSSLLLSPPLFFTHTSRAATIKKRKKKKEI